MSNQPDLTKQLDDLLIKFIEQNRAFECFDLVKSAWYAGINEYVRTQSTQQELAGFYQRGYDYAFKMALLELTPELVERLFPLKGLEPDTWK